MTATPELLRATGSHSALPDHRPARPPGPGGARGRLLLLSHGRVQWFDPADRTVTVVRHAPGSRFRGAYAAEAAGAVVVLTTPDMRAESRFEELDLQTGAVRRHAAAAGTRDGHDMVRVGELVYVVSTKTGAVNVYGARDFEFRRSHTAGFTEADHINTIGLTSSGMYLMLHNQVIRAIMRWHSPYLLHEHDRTDARPGWCRMLRNNQNKKPSEIRLISRFEQQSFDSFPGIGQSAHGLAWWARPDTRTQLLVALDSLGGRLGEQAVDFSG